MKCIIHIGAVKTGTTTLQEYLSLNRDKLREAGAYYPKTPGAKQHSLLAFYAMEHDRNNQFTHGLPLELTQDRAAWRQEFSARLAREIAETELNHLLLSSELLHSQVLAPAEVVRLKTLLDKWCNHYRIIFYMRRQDKCAASRYSTALRAGWTTASLLPEAGQPMRLYNYDAVLTLWESIFGHESIVPRLYEKADLVDGDLIRDFVFATGLRIDVEGSAMPENRNPSLSIKAQQLLLQYNQSALLNPMPVNDRIRLQRAVAALLEEAYPGPSILPTRTQAQRFYEHYRASNACVARKWFGRGQLFLEDFDHYPETNEMEHLSTTEIMDFASLLGRRLIAQA